MFEKLRQSIKALDNQTVKVGHFNEQGLHYSGMTYPQLLAFWFIGVEQSGSMGRLRQDVRGQFSFNYFISRQVARDPKMKLALKKWAVKATSGDNTASLLDDVGEVLRREYSLTFNVNEGPHMLGTETPLFETGELAGTSAYKTSKSPKVKEL
jgi:hypothetical protein